MSITKDEARQWTGEGAQTGAKATYDSVQFALSKAGLVSSANLEIFLQGSYANATNVRADSDVDIVVMSKRAFNSDTTKLSPSAKQRWDRLPEGGYTRDQLRDDVFRALVAHYGSSRVEEKNKCIRVAAGSGTLDADVVPSLQFRKFTSAEPDFSRDFIEGITINPLQGTSIHNYPKSHIKNGQAKNANSHLNYKKTVRQVKRLRSRAVDLGATRSGIAPGYLLECMTFNVPSTLFSDSDDWKRLAHVLSWLKDADMRPFWSCDEVHRLFVDDPGDFSAVTGSAIAKVLWDVL